MSPLEDTINFKVATLDDLLEAEVRTGVPPAANDKYKRWAFLSTGMAALFAIGLVVAVVTGGGGREDAPPVTEFPGRKLLPVQVERLSSDIAVNKTVTVYAAGNPVVWGVPVGSIVRDEGILKDTTIEVAVKPEEASKLRGAIASGAILTVELGTEKPTLSTSPPAGASPAETAPPVESAPPAETAPPVETPAPTG